MSDASVSRLRSVVPILPVADVEAALSYYTSVLGFRIGWAWGQPPTVASVCRDEVELMLERRPASDPGRFASVYVMVTGIDAFCDQAALAGATIVEPLAVRDYGMKDCRVVDPDGNQLSFGEPCA